LVVGAPTEEQLVDNPAAVDLTLSDDERARLDAVSAPPQDNERSRT
jgi:aryl-alcohol dehydrogenase-like predicted oxidoreductase